jgi:hypothetical protein
MKPVHGRSSRAAPDGRCRTDVCVWTPSAASGATVMAGSLFGLGSLVASAVRMVQGVPVDGNALALPSTAGRPAPLIVTELAVIEPAA